jgi:hypothetical protein
MSKSESDNLFAGFDRASEHPDVPKMAAPKPDQFRDATKMIKPMPLAPHNGTDTSRAAALALDPAWRATTCGKVYAAIVAAGEAAITREELTDVTGMPIQTVCGRVNDLLKTGMIYEPEGVTRPTKSGRAAQVVRAKQ